MAPAADRRPFSVAGRRALITGASGGIGGAIARSLATGGASVMLSGRRAEPMRRLAEELEASGAPRAHVAVADLGDAAAVARLAEEARERLGGVDILVNNAGLTRDALLLRLKDGAMMEALQVNLLAALSLTRACLPFMLRGRWGRVIHISSVVASSGNAGQTAYCAAKAALEGLARSLAREVATRAVTVNCVAPGFITTAMTEHIAPDARARLLASIPAARLGSPEDIAPCVRFLACDEAGYITGQVLHVNGGMFMT